ncbi:MAG: hypothetical protein LBU27_02830 [Candidatus Peribacteria bacterium]|nr:hypothetical protein [Candidatus Peribacteria bacterium]
MEYFKERVSKFVVIRDLIVAKQAERLFFHKIRLRDLGMFSKNINRFTAEDKAIIEDLAIGSEKQKAIRLLNSSPSQEEKKAEPVVEKSPLTEEQKKEKKEMFKRIQEKIIQKTTI